VRLEHPLRLGWLCCGKAGADGSKMAEMVRRWARRFEDGPCVTSQAPIG
jgi:hypothetical protein